MKWLRYLLDRIGAWTEPHCPEDWMDDHTFDYCCRCERIAARNTRIATYRTARRLPRARVKVIVP